MLGDIPPIVRGQNYVAVRARKKRSRLRRERPTGPYALSSLEPDICAHQRAFAHHNSVRRTSPAAERRAQYAASTSKSCWESTRKVATLRPHRKRRRGWPLSRRTVPKRGRPRLSDALSRDNGHVERRARVKPEVRLRALLPSLRVSWCRRAARDCFRSSHSLAGKRAALRRRRPGRCEDHARPIDGQLLLC